MLGFDDTYSDEDVKKSPTAREQNNDFVPDSARIKTIVTQEDIDISTMDRRFASQKNHVEFVNGTNWHITEDFERRDPTGKIVKNDDVVGYSWLYDIPIPGYLYGECHDLYGKHGCIRVFCISRDGNVITIKHKGKKYMVSMCNTCIEIFAHYEFVKKWSLFLVKNPIYKMTHLMQEI